VNRPAALPANDTGTEVRPQRPRKVILHNDDVHAFDEVILQVQKATGCSLEQATAITWTAHTRGLAVAFEGPFERCELVAAVLQQIRLRVSID
jgi:ATP-dependent Clp protease adapter protein ClpS